MKRTDDMFFWYNNPPYLRYWAKFTSEAAQLDEKEKAEKKSLPEHRRKLNEWKFMGARGRIYSEFKGGVKKPYNYQEKFLFCQTLKNSNLLKYKLTSLAPSLHREFSMGILKRNVKRAPAMSMFIE